MIIGLLFVSCFSFADTAETVFMLSDDLESATKYYNSRGDGVGNYSFLFDSEFNTEQIMYARPENYNWGRTTHNGNYYRKLHFSQTPSYAYLERKSNNNEFLTKISPTRYRLHVDGSECMDQYCRMDENIIAVVMPKRFKVLNYDASVKGNWKIVDSTYTFYSRYIKGASVELIFEDRFALIYAKVFDDMSIFKGIQVENIGGAISVVMPMDNVFGAGSTKLNEEGINWVKQLGNTLKTIPFKEVKVEGHADSIPVRNGSIYPSNWELSAARAAMALRLLVEKGIEQNKLVAVAYGDSRPIAENTSLTGRAKNRRISFNIIPETPDGI